MLELGAGAGRNTPRYHMYDRVVLLDFSRTQLEQARQRLGAGGRYVFVAADVYRLPFVPALFDGATMIRTLHHMADPGLALSEVRRVIQSGGAFILEFANKRNLKAMLRYLLGKQDWTPYSLEAVEFAELNFDFHPRAVRQWLADADFDLERQLTVSHLRVGVLKRHLPLKLLTAVDGLLQWTGGMIQVSPSVFTRSRAAGEVVSTPVEGFFQCPACGQALDLVASDVVCPACKAVWPFRDGIYDFRLSRT
jgi:SAM-dependent methyltransferase